MAAQLARWGVDDCVSFALPELDRKASLALSGAISDEDAINRLTAEYGTLEDAWRAGLEWCGYTELLVVEDYRDGDRLLGRDEVYGWTVAVIIDGGTWVRGLRGRTRASFQGETSHWRRMA